MFALRTYVGEVSSLRQEKVKERSQELFRFTPHDVAISLLVKNCEKKLLNVYELLVINNVTM